jgi:predicted RNase H-like HicB family nuclease
MATSIQAEFKLFGTVKREGDWYIAHCPPLDVTTQGRSAAEARENLREASELFIVSCLERGTFDQALRELGWKPHQEQRGGLPAGAFELIIPIPFRFAKNHRCPV